MPRGKNKLELSFRAERVLRSTVVQSRFDAVRLFCAVPLVRCCSVLHMTSCTHIRLQAVALSPFDSLHMSNELLQHQLASLAGAEVGVPLAWPMMRSDSPG